MTKKYESLSDIWKLKRRGKRDSDRHKELVERAIRKNGKDIITEYNIIRSDGNKKVKVPIKFLDKYRFKYGKLKDQKGTGQGLDGKAGDKYKMKNGKKGNGKPGKPGDKDGERIFEAEITIDEMVDILMEELNLPWMDPNNSVQIEVEKEEVSSRSKKGIYPNLDLKRTLIENIKRNAAKGNPKVGNFNKDDLRYRTWDTEVERHSNAAVYLMMDRSGSMTKKKTEIAKTFYFWMVQFLKKRYKKIDLIFIAHDIKAFIVDEKEFFSISASGGTMCSSAFKLAYEHISANHPPDSWNNYVFEFSDGDALQGDQTLCLEYARKMLPMVRAMGYGEILLKGSDRHSWYGPESLLSNNFNKNIKRTKFLSIQISKKEEVFEALKKFFNVEGSNDKNTRDS